METSKNTASKIRDWHFRCTWGQFGWWHNKILYFEINKIEAKKGFEFQIV